MSKLLLLQARLFFPVAFHLLHHITDLIENQIQHRPAAILIGGIDRHMTGNRVLSVLVLKRYLHRKRLWLFQHRHFSRQCDHSFLVFLLQHKESILIHPLIDSRLFHSKLPEEPAVYIHDTNIISLRGQCHDAARQGLRKAADLLHIRPQIFARHSDVHDFKSDTLAVKRQRTADIDRGFLVLRNQIDIKHRNRRGLQTRGRPNGCNIHVVDLRILLNRFPQEFMNRPDAPQMPDFIRRDPDDVICKKRADRVHVLFIKK